MDLQHGRFARPREHERLRSPSALCLLLGMLAASVACRAEMPGDHARESSDAAGPLPMTAPDGVSETLEALPPGPSSASPTQRSDGGDAYPPPKIAAISLDEARRRTAAQLDPDSRPEPVSAGALTAGALARELDGAFTQWDAWYRPADDPPGRWLFLVLYRQTVAETDGLDGVSGSSGSATDPAANPWSFRRREEWVAGIWDIETGQRLALGLALPHTSSPSSHASGDLRRLSVRQIQPPLIEATVTAIPICPGPGCGWAEATPEPPSPMTFQTSPLLRDIDPSLRESLRAYPLFPGNRWTYRYHLWEMGLGCSATVTETVRSIDALPDKRALATLDRGHSAGGPDCLERDWEPWLAGDASRVVLDGRDVYVLPSDVAVARLLEALGRPTPSPPAAGASDSRSPIETLAELPMHDPWSGKPFPSWRLGSGPGDRWPTLPGVRPIATWQWSAIGVRALRTSSLRLPACMVATWGPNGTCCTRAFCPGLGIAMEHDHASGSTRSDVIIELVDYDLPRTIDTAW